MMIGCVTLSRNQPAQPGKAKTLAEEAQERKYIFMYYLCCSETGAHFAVQAGLHLAILLPPLPEYWAYSHEPPLLPVVRYFLNSRRNKRS